MTTVVYTVICIGLLEKHLKPTSDNYKFGFYYSCICSIYLAMISSKSTGTAAAENTALTDDISSGPTPSPGIIVTL